MGTGSVTHHKIHHSVIAAVIAASLGNVAGAVIAKIPYKRTAASGPISNLIVTLLLDAVSPPTIVSELSNDYANLCKIITRKGELFYTIAYWRNQNTLS